MESNHPINDVVSMAMEKMREMLDVNTIIGTAIQAGDGVTLIPVSKVTFGFTSGGADFSKDPAKFGGGVGAGASIAPIAFIVVNNGSVRILPVSAGDNAAAKVADMLPDVMDRVSSYLKDRKEKK